MAVAVEVVAGEDLGGGVEGLVVHEDRAEHGALGVGVVRKRLSSAGARLRDMADARLLARATCGRRGLALLGDEELQGRRDLGVELDLHLVLAELLDGLLELHLALVDVDALAPSGTRRRRRR